MDWRRQVVMVQLSFKKIIKTKKYEAKLFTAEWRRVLMLMINSAKTNKDYFLKKLALEVSQVSQFIIDRVA